MTERTYLEQLCRWGRLTEAHREAEAQELWNELQLRQTAAAEEGCFLPFPYVCAAFDLGERESQLLALALLTSLEEELEGLTRKRAERWLTGSERSGGERLEQYCLQSGELLLPQRRIAEFVLDRRWQDAGIPGLQLLVPGEEAPPAQREQARKMKEYIRTSPAAALTFVLSGTKGAGRKTLALACAAQLETPVLLADGDRLTGENGGLFRTELMREAWLQRCPVLFKNLDLQVDLAFQEPAQARELERLLKAAAEPFGVSFLACSGTWPAMGEEEGWELIPLELPMPDMRESETLWIDFLKAAGVPSDVDPARLAGKYRLTPGAMQTAVREAAAHVRWQGRDRLTDGDLDLGCRRQFRHSLGDKARRVETVFAWEDLILPDASKELLRSACDQVRCRSKVYESWGFGSKLPYGSGLSMLFSGPPGTGKTMGAQVAAGELGLELYKVELPAVVSKYVGETEQNLSRIFREAGRSQAILFFDEADVLFGKRTETRDAQDKYSNMEAAYLLQKMEEYPGVSILATNFLQNFDEAFKRRLKFIIDFPFPDAGYRLKLWKAVFPKETPLSGDVDFEFLSEHFELSGSAIKNTAVNAAFLAAGQERRVGMAEILTALRREMQKSGKQLSREDFGEYYILAEEGKHGGAGT